MSCPSVPFRTVVLSCAVLISLAVVTPVSAGLLGIAYEVLYDIDTANGTPSNPRAVGDKINSIAVSPSGILYGISQGIPTDLPPGGRLFTIDINFGTPTLVDTLDTFINVEGDIAFDPTTGILYAVDSQGLLFTVDLTTAEGTTVGTIGLNMDLSAMAFDASGNLYVLDSFGPTLLKVNKANANIIATVPLDPVNQEIGGLAFSPGGTLYYAGGSTSKLYTLDTNTGSALTLGPIGVSGGIWGLAFAQEAVPVQATTWGRLKRLP